LEANQIDIKDRTPASKKLQAEDARKLLGSASRLLALKGKKISNFSVGGVISDDALAAIVGPTGNLRAPTIRRGKTLIVGFNQEVFEQEFCA